jgi:hypothetical protein
LRDMGHDNTFNDFEETLNEMLISPYKDTDEIERGSRLTLHEDIDEEFYTAFLLDKTREGKPDFISDLEIWADCPKIKEMRHAYQTIRQFLEEEVDKEILFDFALFVFKKVKMTLTITDVRNIPFIISSLFETFI